MNPIKYNDFNAASLMVGDLNKTKNGQNVFVKYLGSGSPKVIIQTPVMSAPFGVSSYPAENNNRYSLDLSFNNYENDHNIGDIKNVIDSIDSAMIEFGIQYSVPWFGKSIPRDVMSELYRPILKHSKDGKYAPTFKMKIRNDYNTGKPMVECFDHNNYKINFDKIQKGDKVKAIFELSPIWFMNKQFGVSMNVTQIMIVESKPKMTASSFMEED